MSRPRFFADEDLRREIVLAIRRMEPAIEFATVDELGRKGTSDGEILEYANQSGVIVVSHDVNSLKALADLRISDGRGIAGLFLASQFSATRRVAETLLLIWAGSESEEWRDRVVFVPW